MTRPIVRWGEGEFHFDPRMSGIGIQWLFGERTLKTVQRVAARKGRAHHQTGWLSAARHPLGHPPQPRGLHPNHEGPLMPHGDIETFLDDGQWHNRVEGEDGILSSHGDKQEAAAAGQREAHERKVAHLIKKETGSIGETNGHGQDRREVPGCRLPSRCPTYGRRAVARRFGKRIRRVVGEPSGPADSSPIAPLTLGHRPLRCAPEGPEP